VRLRRVAALKVHVNAGVGRLLPGEAKLAFREVQSGHAVASRGKLDGVPARAATDIQNPLGAIGVQFPLNEVHFARGSLREGLLVVGFPVVFEERLVPLRHVSVSCNLPSETSMVSDSTASPPAAE